MTNKEKFYKMLDFCTNHDIVVIFNKDAIAYCYLDTREIYLGHFYLVNKRITTDMLFDFLHEIGHILTNTIGEPVGISEYKATQWSIDNSKLWGLKPSNKYKDTYNEYIINCGCDLKLNWGD